MIWKLLRWATELFYSRHAISDQELDRLLGDLRDALPQESDPDFDPVHRERVVDWLVTSSGPPPAAPGRSRPGPPAGTHAEPSLARLWIVASRWSRAVANEGYLDDDYTTELAEFLRELTLHVISADLAAKTAEEIGHDLAVRIRVTPGGFRVTLELLAEFLSSLEHGHPRCSTCWTAVLAKVSEGYAEGTRMRALEGQKDLMEALHRARNTAVNAALVSAQRFEALFEDSPLAMGMIDSTGHLTSVNDSLCRLLGRSAPEVLGRDLASLAYHEHDQHMIRSLYPTMSAGHTTATWWDFRLTSSGARPPTWIRLQWGRHRSDQDVPIIVEDVTKHRVLRRWLHDSLQHDEPSDMPTRHHFLERLDDLLSQPATAGRVGLYGVRLEGLDDVATRLGPAAAARTARILAARARYVAEHAEMVTNLDDDTIGILLSSPDGWAEAATMMKHVAQWLAAPVKASDDYAVSITPVIAGVAADPEHTDTNVLTQRLDHRLRGNAPVATRGRWTITDTSACDRDHHRNNALAKLAQALEVDDVRFVHSPIVMSRGGKVVGSQATLDWRWPHEWRVPLHEVLDLADDLGVAAAVGEWMVSRGAQLVAEWHREFGDRSPFLRINLPRHQPLSGTLVSQLVEAPQVYRFPAHLLQLGMEEVTMLDRNGHARPELVTITGNGTRVVLNGFGDRVRRIGLLAELPITGVVMARELSGALTGEPVQTTAKSMIQTLIELATALDLKVTVPGVDTREQRDKVRKFGGTNHHGALTGENEDALVVVERVRTTLPEIRAV